MSNHLVINGIPKNIDSNQSLRDLLQYLRQNLCNETAIISSIRIAGQELTEDDEKNLQASLVTQLGDIEVFTSHPHELAQETLLSLIPYTTVLEGISKDLAQQIRSPRMGVNLDFQYQRLIEGLCDLTDAVRGVKQILRLHTDPDVTLLEVDLASVLEDILSSQKEKNFAYLSDLLDQHLPFNLQEWRDRGIPKLIRSRDS